MEDGGAPKGNEQKQGPSGAFQDLGRYSGYGMAWAFTTLLGFLVGLKLDQWLGSIPWLTILGAFAGAAAGFYTLYVRFIVEPESKKDKGE